MSAGRTVSPYSAETAGPAYAAARAAYTEAFGEPVVEIGVGGSIGFVAPFAAAFPDAEILITGVEDPDTRAHSPNESLHLGDFSSACLAEALLLDRLARGTWRSPAGRPTGAPGGRELAAGAESPKAMISG